MLMDRQLQILKEIIEVTETNDIPIWFYGGYALDALEQRTVRSHGDIDFFVREQDREKLRKALTSSGFAVSGRNPSSTFFVKMGQSVECLTYRQMADGMYVTDTGETGIYPWPDNSFPDEPNAVLMDKPVRIISYEALYVFKAGYQTYDPRQPLRDKDVADLRIVCQHIPLETREKLALLFDPLPGTRKRYPDD